MSVSICVLNNNELAKELGKKGTGSDIVIYNRKSGADSFTFFVPHSYPDKLSSLLQCIGASDVALLYVNAITKELGEIIVALDSFGLDRGVLVLDGTSIEELAPFIKGSVVEGYSISERDYASLMESISKHSSREVKRAVKVEIDHFFDVKSVGTVALGIVKRGVLEKHAKLDALPLGKEVLVRSIQIHDEDVQSAAFGSRVGLALKGVKPDELSRGSLVASKESVNARDVLEFNFRKSPYYKKSLSEGQMLFVSVRMQYTACRMERVEGEKIRIKARKKIAYEPGDRVLLANQDSKGLRVIGGGRIEWAGHQIALE